MAEYIGELLFSNDNKKLIISSYTESFELNYDQVQELISLLKKFKPEN